MQNKLFLKAADICELLEVKQTSAYLVHGPYIKNISQLCFWSGCVVNQGNTFRAFLNPAVHLLVPDFHRCHCGCLWTLCIQDIKGEYIDTENEYMYYYSVEFVK